MLAYEGEITERFSHPYRSWKSAFWLTDLMKATARAINMLERDLARSFVAAW